MNASRTTWPRASESLTTLPAGSRSAKSGAGAIRLRLGRALSAKDSDSIPAGFAGLPASRFLCPHAAGPIAGARTKATLPAPLTSRPLVEQHVVRPRRARGRLREVDRG